ncbi:hypothetical protein E4U43_003115 [Claviceps pusilla]|uniref:Serine protease n=1 Tax=Claviceps pusilla TaxID=123648 RepID=A0A9P7N7B6_9HYPO|nr:hypothetical protein E4U43_003115 [Claviceps pusilla]
MRLLSCVGSIASTLLILHSADAGMTGLGHLVKRPTFPEDREFQAELAAAIASGTVKNATFRQLIDHRRPELGTFSQRYFYNSEWYVGPGAPIILRTPDEAEVWPGYTKNNSQAAVFAKTNGAAVVALEHRYYGKSSPFTNLTTTNLQHLTLENAIQDVIYFAKNVVLPFDVKRSSSPDKAPWVLTGCSYAGSLSAWIHRLYPGTFWAHHCSSAPVEAITDFWQYFEPAREAMPKNCSTDLVNVVKHIDQVLSSGDAKAAYALKKKFGFEALSHNDDFGFAILTPFWYLQNRWFGDSGADPFYRFCDYIENVFPNTTHPARLPGPEGVGVEKALDGYAKWSTEAYIPGWCKGYDYWTKESNTSVVCWDTYNERSPLYHDYRVDNAADRQWMWMLCNEAFEWWQVAGPRGVSPGYVSKFVDTEYNHHQCAKLFPREGNHTYGLNLGRSPATVNRWTGGWGGWGDEKPLRRIMFASGEWDEWRAATVSSDRRPGGRLKSTPDAPVWVIPNGTHCEDASYKNAQANPALAKIFDEMMVKMHAWIDEFYIERRLTRPAF